MRAFLCAFVLLLAVCYVKGNAEDCIITKCPTQLEACAQDVACNEALTCAESCSPSNIWCLRSCSLETAGNATFTAMVSCAAQCIPSVETQVLGLVAEFELPIQVESHCNFAKKAACAVGISGAISSCGGTGNMACVLKLLRAMRGCAKCFCSSHCHGLCKELHLC